MFSLSALLAAKTRACQSSCVMELPPQVLLFAVSLLAIFALTGLTVVLKLGGNPKLDSEDAVRKAADEVLDGFVVQDFAVSADGQAALAIDVSGALMVIKQHGNRFAGRILDGRSSAQRHGEKLTIDSGETRFGTVTLRCSDANAWAERINRLMGVPNA